MASLSQKRNYHMKLSKNQSGEVAMIAIVVVVGLIVGFAIGRVMHKSNMTTSNSGAGMTKMSASAENLNNNLVTLGIQHMTLTNQAIDAALDGGPDASALASALYSNGTTIGSAVGSVYGASAQSTFNSVWKLHLDQFVNYAVADKQGNAAAKTTALNTIQTQYTIPLAQYLAKANPNLPEATLQTLLSDHVSMTAQIIDDHVQANYTKEASDLNMADQHMTTIFSTLAGAIVKQYPSKFAN